VMTLSMTYFGSYTLTYLSIIFRALLAVYSRFYRFSTVIISSLAFLVSIAYYLYAYTVTLSEEGVRLTIT